ncbi:MAG: TetR/AcrR family transcriptional regulator [Myxococcales bacterium]|nr:TetR/AcrR family transcriptional regulator [Myxococcales bacterium]
MNRAGPSRKRDYNNSLREEQAARTRDRIIQAVIAALAESGDGNVSIAEIATRAGVSEPTIYRHFKNREGLYAAIDDQVQKDMGMPPMPTSLDTLPGHACAVFERFEQHAELLQAAFAAGLGREAHLHSRGRRHGALRQLIDADADHYDADSRRLLSALSRVLISYDAWQRLTGELGLDSEEAGRATAWGCAALLDAIERDRCEGRSSIGGTEHEGGES